MPETDFNGIDRAINLSNPDMGAIEHALDSPVQVDWEINNEMVGK